MNRILWIAHREFLAIVWTKAFLIGLLFLPIMVGVVALVISLLATMTSERPGASA